MREVNPRENEVVAVKGCQVLAANTTGHLGTVEWDVQRKYGVNLTVGTWLTYGSV